MLHECSYPCNARTSVPIPTVFLILLFTEVTATVSVTLLLLLLCYYCCYITVATDKLCQGSLLSGAAELTIHLLRLINILWLPLCRINKFGFYFPRRLLRSPILVGHHTTRYKRVSSTGLLLHPVPDVPRATKFYARSPADL